ncbi:uncharacterized protein [Apostichopus japonicus]|uniref:uncharacterized protein n=1 Tax=Stichopus japonicus TaxID=307972 RepID=UPI003AB609CB
MEAIRSSHKTKTMSSDLIVDNFPVIRKYKRLVIELKRCRLLVDSTTLIRGEKWQKEALLDKPTDHSSHMEQPRLKRDASHVLNGINVQTRTDEMSDTDNDEARIQEEFSNNKKRARLDVIVYRLQRRVLAESPDTVTDSTVLALNDKKPSAGGVDDIGNCGSSMDTSNTTQPAGLQVVEPTSKANENLDRTGMESENIAEYKHVAMVTSSSSKCRETSSQYSNNTQGRCQNNHGKCIKQQVKSKATFPMRLENRLGRGLQVIHPCIKYVYFPNNPCAHSSNIVWPPCIDTTRTNEVNQLKSYWTFSPILPPSHTVPCMVSALPIPTANTSIVLPWIQQQQRSFPNVALPCNISQTRTFITKTNRILHTS